MKNTSVRRLTLSAMLLAIGMLLPFLTGQIQRIGNMLCPMHLPVFICGMVCGPLWGLAVGAVLPVLRSMVFGMPVLMPMACAMAFELGAYGLISGLLRRRLPRTLPMLYVSLIAAMIAGRAVWGIVRCVMMFSGSSGFGWAMFISGAFTTAIPGIIVQLVLIPIIIMARKKARLIDKEAYKRCRSSTHRRPC